MHPLFEHICLIVLPIVLPLGLGFGLGAKGPGPDRLGFGLGGQGSWAGPAWFFISYFNIMVLLYIILSLF